MNDQRAKIRKTTARHGRPTVVCDPITGIETSSLSLRWESVFGPLCWDGQIIGRARPHGSVTNLDTRVGEVEGLHGIADRAGMNVHLGVGLPSPFENQLSDFQQSPLVDGCTSRRTGTRSTM